MRSSSQQVADMDTESSDVSSSLTTDPENAEISALVVLNDLALIDSSHSQLLLHSGDQRGSLEDSSSQLFEGLIELLGLVEGLMQLDDCHVLLSG